MILEFTETIEDLLRMLGKFTGGMVAFFVLLLGVFFAILLL